MSNAHFRYRLGLNQPADSPTARRITEMAEAIGQETGGELLLEVFPESRLGPDPKMFADLRAGVLDFFLAGATLGEVAPTSALPLLRSAIRKRSLLPSTARSAIKPAPNWRKTACTLSATLCRTASTTSPRAQDRSAMPMISRD